jgi:hypothetical protein
MEKAASFRNEVRSLGLATRVRKLARAVPSFFTSKGGLPRRGRVEAAQPMDSKCPICFGLGWFARTIPVLMEILEKARQDGMYV